MKNRNVFKREGLLWLYLCVLHVSGDEIKSVDVSGVPPPLATIIADNSHVLSGGISRPVDCAARQRIAVIITYKDRWSHLLHLLSHLHPLLQKQQAHYQIYVVEQVILECHNYTQ